MDLRAIRKQHGFTLKQVAEKIHASEATISLVETGKRKPSVTIAKRIGKLYGISLDDIYRDEPTVKAG